MATKAVGVRDLKDQAPKLVRRAERGERLVITRHGEPVAVLGPPSESRAAGADRPRLREWERERRAFERLRPKLPRKLIGRFVAVSNGRVVGSDVDAGRLFSRMARALRGKTFFIGRVGDAEPVVDLPGFSLE